MICDNCGKKFNRGQVVYVDGDTNNCKDCYFGHTTEAN